MTNHGPTRILGCTVLAVASACHSAPLRVLGENVSTADAIKSTLDSLSAVGTSFGALAVELVPYLELVRKSDEDFAACRGHYDLVLQYNTALANYYRNGYVVPLDSLQSIGLASVLDSLKLIEGDLFPAQWHETGWYGPANAEPRPFAMPFTANTMLLAYRKSLFGDARLRGEYARRYGRPLEVPHDWQSYFRVLEFFTRPAEGIFGTILEGSDYWIYYEWTNHAFGRGGGVMKKQWGWEGDESTPLILSSDSTVAATLDFINQVEFSPFRGPGASDPFTVDNYGKVRAFADRRIAMVILWSDVARALMAERVGPDVGFATIPGSVSMLAGGSFYVNACSTKRAQAFNLIKYLLQSETQRSLVLRGLGSPRRSVYDDPAVVRAVPYASALKESLDRGVYMLEAGPDADVVISRISARLQTLLRERLGGRVSVARVRTVMQELEADLRRERSRVFMYLRPGNR